MYDLAVSNHGDLLFSAARDLQGKSGIPLFDQQIVSRLRIRRGTWIYDLTKTLGSRIPEILNRPREEAASMIPAFVQEALREMDDDITIIEIVTSSDFNTVNVQIHYTAIVPGVQEPQLVNVVTVPFVIGSE
jgi:hypothetical protein